MENSEAPALGETLAVLLARDMVDGEKVIIGTNSDIQLAACNLARQMQAPRLWWISGPGGMVNPTRDHLLSTRRKSATPISSRRAARLRSRARNAKSRFA